MQYTEGEIVREYNQARYKNKQIGILAQLNTCQRKDIIEILERNGVEIPDKYKTSREEEYNYGTMVAKEKRPYRMKSKVKEPEKAPEEKLDKEVDDYLKAQEETKTYIIPEKEFPKTERIYVDGQLIYSTDQNQQSNLENEKPNIVDKPKADYYATWLRLELLDRKMTKLERKYKRLKKMYKQLAKFILG